MEDVHSSTDAPAGPTETVTPPEQPNPIGQPKSVFTKILAAITGRKS